MPTMGDSDKVIGTSLDGTDDLVPEQIKARKEGLNLITNAEEDKKGS